MVLKKFVSLFRSKIFKVVAFFALLATSVLIALAMLLGQEAGQFVIKVQDAAFEKSIQLCENREADGNFDDNKLTSTLSPTGVSGFSDYTASYFIQYGFNDLEALTATGGLYQNSNKSLYGYTFYIVNNTADGSSVGINVTMQYRNATKGVEKAIRVLTYARSSINATPQIYQASDTEEVTYENYVITPQIFSGESKDSSEIFTQDYIVGHTASQQKQANYDFVKYSVFIWLEGQDPECNEEIAGGTIEFSLNISIKQG